jgi:hypothetical protein
MIENPRSTSTSCRDAQDLGQPRLAEDVGEHRSERERQRVQPGRYDGREDHRRRGSRTQVAAVDDQCRAEAGLLREVGDCEHCC